MSHLDFSEVGVYDRAATDQGEKLQEWIDRAARVPGGSVSLSGTVRSDRPLDNSTNVPIFGLGSGDNWNTAPSAILFGKDVAEQGTPAIQHKHGWRPVVMRGLTLAGPGWGRPAGWGNLPANLDGFNVPTRARIEDVVVRGFGAACSSVNDHQVYRDCDFRGNGYAIDFADNPDGGLGDMRFDQVLFNDQTRAGIALSDSACLANARFTGNSHLGMSPFCVYRYAGKAETKRGQALVGVTFENTSFEYAANSVFYDEPGTGDWVRVTFDTPAEWGTFGNDGARWPGKPTDLANYECGASAQNFRWLHGSPAGVRGHHLIRARSINGVFWDHLNLGGIIDGNWKPLGLSLPYSEHGFEVNNVSLGLAGRRSGGNIATARRAHEKILKGDLLEMVSYGHVRRARNDGTSWPVGFSPANYEQGDVAIVCSQFDQHGMIVRNTSDTVIPQGGLIKPDPGRIGGVKRATGMSNGPIFGRVNDAPIPAGGTGRAMIAF